MSLLDNDAFRKELLDLRAKMAAEDSLYEFLKQAWPYIEGADVPFVDAWHIQAVAEHLEALSKRQIRNLLINMPPRCCKSSLISVAFFVWQWIQKPSEQFLFTSYGLSLARRDSIKCRRLIQSPWFQKNWGHLFSIEKDRNTQGRFDNNKKGYRLIASFSSTTTGEGGSIIIADDPNSGEDIKYETKRENKIDYWTGVLSTRLNDKATGCKALIQQRLHERDITGYVLSHDFKKEWTTLILPMEFEEKRRCSTIIVPSSYGKIWTDPRIKENDLLWPDRFDREAVESLKRELGSESKIAGQLQQRPSAAEGSLIRKSHFKHWKSSKSPDIEHVLQSWDTAISDSDTANYSAMSCWGVFYDNDGIGNVILLSVWRGRLNYPDLRAKAQRLYHNYRDTSDTIVPNMPKRHIDVCLIESKATGDPLIKDLRRAGIVATPFNPSRLGDKIGRVNGITHLIENGLVWLPAQSPNFDMLRPDADMFLEEINRFPNAESRDFVDTMTQALFRLQECGMLNHTKNERYAEQEFKKRNLY